jgi:hypothetical protein
MWFVGVSAGRRRGTPADDSGGAGEDIRPVATVVRRYVDCPEQQPTDPER